MSSQLQQLRASPALLALCLSPLLTACTAATERDSSGDVDASNAGSSCTDAVTSSAEVLASDPNASPALALTTTTLFWVDRGASVRDSIQSVPLAGGHVSTVYSATPDETAAIEDVVTDGTNLYFVQVSGTDGGYMSEVKSVPTAGGDSTVLATVSGELLEVAVVSGYVYFSGGYTVERVPTQGGQVEGIPGGIGGAGLVSNGSSLYWIGNNDDLTGLFSVDGTAKSLVSGEAANESSADLVQVLSANAESLFWPCSDDAGTSLCGSSVAGGGAVDILGSLSEGAFAIQSDDTNVYVMLSERCSTSLGKFPVAGGAMTTIASGFTPAAEIVMSHAIALDDTYIYWVEQDGNGRVVRAPK